MLQTTAFETVVLKVLTSKQNAVQTEWILRSLACNICCITKTKY